MTKLSILPNTHTYRVIAAIVGLAILFGISAAARTFAADNTPQTGERFISIHDRGVEKGILTTASTLRKALDEAKISIDANDLVEPGLDAELVADSYQVNIYRARPVVVNDGTSSERILSAYQTPEQIAVHAGITLQDEDKAKLSLNDDMVSHGASLQVDIDRATPFTLVLYGNKTQAYTQETSVSGMLKAKNITLEAADTLSVAKDASITTGMTVEIWRNGKQTITEEQEIAFETEKIQDVNREVGFREIKTAGENGKKAVTYEVVMKNGVEESRKEIQAVVTGESKKQVEIIGAKLPTPTNPSEAQALGRQMMLAAGYGDDQWPCLYTLWMRESGWRTTAGNPSSGAYGIPQSLPASKMAAYGADYLTSASVQISWGLNYIKGRYGTPCGAYNKWQTSNWY